MVPDICSELDALVEEHNHLYVVIFKDTLKFKHHNLTHASRNLLMVGPLLLTGCMRMEAKHRSATLAAKATNCRKNILKTLTLREQMTQSSRPSNDDELQCSALKFCDVLGTDLDLNNFASCVPKNANFMCTNSVTILGVQYKVGSYVNIGFKDEYSLPLFGKICFILMYEKDVFYLLVHEYDTLCFNNHFHAYQVGNEYVYRCFKLDELLNRKVLNGHYIKGALYITPHHVM